MSDAERRLHDALHATAAAAVDENRQPPPFTPHPTVAPEPRRRAWLAPLLAAAAVVAVATAGAVTVAVLDQHGGAPAAAPSGSALPSSVQAATRPSTPTVAGAPVHVSLLESDGSTWGIGMPIVARFDKAPTDAAAFDRSVTVTVDGRPADGAWFWMKSSDPKYQLEAHYRPRTFWPAHATIQVRMPLKGRSAGAGLVYDDDLTLHMATGAATVATVDAATAKLTVTSDGKQVGVFPVSLGAPATPTMRGTKVVLYKGANERMVGSGYDEVVPWALRLTNSGEYLHAAPWNVANIQAGRATSDGCTNLLPADAQKLFDLMEVGDVVIYPDAPGKTVPSWDGYGDWNLAWATWQAGGLLSGR